MPRVSDAHKDAVRRRLMDAAITCLQRNGYRDITTRELLAEAGLSTGTFYNYFPSKEHLYEALAEELLAHDIERLLKQHADGQSLGYGLLRFLSDYAMVEPEAAVAVSTFRGRVHETGEAAEAIARLNRFVVEGFTPLVQQAQAEGFLRPDIDPEATVELLDIIWDGLGRRQATGTFQTSYRRVGETVLKILLSGALAPGRQIDTSETAPRPVPPNPRFARPRASRR
ncbi:MAG: TetR/AcrR family transcriptional regulator [Acidimicrobiales bacterium]|nr:TetR/AcrR family transcriptional regulator [Acidimicrobiales bacterium]